MTDYDFLTDQFEQHRAHLHAVAYRMLGSASEADDAVQEAWLRFSRADSDAVSNLGGWLTTVTGRIALDMLRARRSRREDYVGSWLPEPIVHTDNELDDLQKTEFRDLSKLDIVGIYPNYAEAYKAWNAKARETIDFS